MPATAPLPRLRPRHVLHVLNALAIPLVVERRKVVRRTFPLFVNILVASLTNFRFHKVLAWNLAAPGTLRGTGEEWTRSAVAFLVHRSGRHVRILYVRPTTPLGMT